MALFNQFKSKTALEEAEDAMGAMRGTIEVLSQRLHDKLTVRDHFAMVALPAIIQNKGIQTPEIAAETAYQVADVMLKIRSELGEDK